MLPEEKTLPQKECYSEIEKLSIEGTYDESIQQAGAGRNHTSAISES